MSIFSKNKLILIVLFVLGILITTLPSLSRNIAPVPPVTATIVPVTPTAFPTPTIEATPTPEPFKIQLVWFYKPPSDRADLNLLVQNFDFFILTHKGESERDKLRSMGVMQPFFQYLLLAEIRDPGNCTDLPYGNQVAFQPGDFCKISAENPDWFLTDAFGNRIKDGNQYFMDPSNTGFRTFWLSRARAMQEDYSWDSVFIDNAQAGLGRFRDLNSLPQRYKTDQEYQAAVHGFLQYLRVNYFNSTSGHQMYANITNIQSYKAWGEYLDTLDGVLVENFAAGWLGRNKSREEWEAQLEAIEMAHQLGKATLLVSQGEQDDTNRQEFSFASYLLIANELTFFRYANSNYYNQVWLYKDYQVGLGKPLTPRYQSGIIWRRNFSNGYVEVNPDTLESRIVIQ